MLKKQEGPRFLSANKQSISRRAEKADRSAFLICDQTKHSLRRTEKVERLHVSSAHSPMFLAHSLHKEVQEGPAVGQRVHGDESFLKKLQIFLKMVNMP